MLTSLPKHRGQHGGVIAVGVLVATSIVVYTTQSPPPAPREAETSHTISSSAQRPAASLPRTQDRAQPTATPIAVPSADPTTSRGTGFVAFDEARTSHVMVPVAGWLEKRRPASVGRAVRQFEPLATVYSVEVYMATVDLIRELREFTSQDALNAARVKLLRFGMPKPTLDRIERTMQPSAALPLATRVPGIVVAEQGAPRGLVEPTELFTVTDPTRVMAFVEVPEADAITVGMPAKLTVDGVEKPLTAKVSYVFRRADEGMRTIRFDVQSRAKLTPGAKVTAVISLRR